jgi:hypothetical protein
MATRPAEHPREQQCEREHEQQDRTADVAGHERARGDDPRAGERVERERAQAGRDRSVEVHPAQGDERAERGEERELLLVEHLGPEEQPERYGDRRARTVVPGGRRQAGNGSRAHHDNSHSS